MADNNASLRIVLTGGGSGGHVYPLIAVAEALEKRVIELKLPTELIYIGPKDAYGGLFASHGIHTRYIFAGKIRRYFSLQNIIDLPKFILGFVQALFTLYFIMPDVIFSKGGTGALPVILAGWFYRIPVVIHESDARPGLTNLTSARFAKKIYTSFKSAAYYFNPKRTEVSGAPMRTELLAGRTTRELAKETLNFDPQQPLTLILGGSQGSTRINNFILENLTAILKDTQVLHQTGVGNFREVQKLSHAVLIDMPTQSRYQPVNYFDKNLAVALTAADLVITRSGSGTLFELAAFGDPALLIPLPEAANDHQRLNAYEIAEAGGAIVIEETNLLPGIFLPQLKGILDNAELRAKMSAAATQFFTPGAAEKIAAGIILAAA